MSFKELQEKIRGLIVTPVTPFKGDSYEVDEENWRKLIRRLIDAGIKEGDGIIVPMSATGEFFSMNTEEKRRITEIAVDEANGKVPICPGANATDWREVISFAEFAEDVGADGLMFGPPYYEEPDEEEVFNFYKQVAGETELGFIVYNNGYATQFDMPTTLLERLATEIDNVVGIKELGAVSGMEYSKIEASIMALKDKVSIFNGPGILFEPYACMAGGVGFCAWNVVNFAPELPLSLWKAIKKEDWEEARNIHNRLMPLVGYVLGNYPPRFKASMNLRPNYPNGGVPRPPLEPVAKDEKKELKGLLDEYDLMGGQ